jgi:hypothetical protein
LEQLVIEFWSESSVIIPARLQDTEERITKAICSGVSSWDMPSLKYLNCPMHATDLLKNVRAPLRKIDFLFGRSDLDGRETLMLPAVVGAPEISFRVELNGSCRIGKKIVFAYSKDGMIHLPRLRTVQFVLYNYNCSRPARRF